MDVIAPWYGGSIHAMIQWWFLDDTGVRKRLATCLLLSRVCVLGREHAGPQVRAQTEADCLGDYSVAASATPNVAPQTPLARKAPPIKALQKLPVEMPLEEKQVYELCAQLAKMKEEMEALKAKAGWSAAAAASESEIQNSTKCARSQRATYLGMTPRKTSPIKKKNMRSDSNLDDQGGALSEAEKHSELRVSWQSDGACCEAPQ